MKTSLKLIAGGMIGAALLVTSAAQARDQIRVVGSSTVFPFATAVAEEFGRTSKYKAPIVESTGSGGGLKLFCAGVGTEHPDVTNASRRIKASEIEKCAANGIQATEVKIGFDGIVLSNSKASPKMNITLRQLYLALAKQVPDADGNLVDNPNMKWSDISGDLPDIKIEVLGPPPTSGTRDAFNELAIEGGCKTFPQMKAMKKTDKKAYKALCRSIREDGAYVEAGENDNLIVQKLQANPNAFGVFGYSFLEQNTDVLQGSSVDGVDPTFDDIAAGDYPVSRSLYFYVKNQHVGVVPGVKEYLEAFVSDDAIGDYGYLADKGLIPLLTDARDAVRSSAGSLTPITVDDLKE